jgi:putative ABC transport system substrate-binding protein
MIRRGWEVFVDDLRERGWEEGRNVVFERRHAGSDPARYPDLAAELVALNVDVIIVTNTQAAAAARSKTTTIPIIVVGVADPVGSGLVATSAASQVHKCAPVVVVWAEATEIMHKSIIPPCSKNLASLLKAL